MGAEINSIDEALKRAGKKTVVPSQGELAAAAMPSVKDLTREDALREARRGKGETPKQGQDREDLRERQPGQVVQVAEQPHKVEIKDHWNDSGTKVTTLYTITKEPNPDGEGTIDVIRGKVRIELVRTMCQRTRKQKAHLDNPQQIVEMPFKEGLTEQEVRKALNDFRSKFNYDVNDEAGNKFKHGEMPEYDLTRLRWQPGVEAVRAFEKITKPELHIIRNVPTHIFETKEMVEKTNAQNKDAKIEYSYFEPLAESLDPELRKQGIRGAYIKVVSNPNDPEWKKHAALFDKYHFAEEEIAESNTPKRPPLIIKLNADPGNGDMTHSAIDKAAQQPGARFNDISLMHRRQIVTMLMTRDLGSDQEAYLCDKNWRKANTEGSAIQGAWGMVGGKQRNDGYYIDLEGPPWKKGGRHMRYFLYERPKEHELLIHQRDFKSVVAKLMEDYKSDRNDKTWPTDRYERAKQLHTNSRVLDHIYRLASPDRERYYRATMGPESAQFLYFGKGAQIPFIWTGGEVSMENCVAEEGANLVIRCRSAHLYNCKMAGTTVMWDVDLLHSEDTSWGGGSWAQMFGIPTVWIGEIRGGRSSNIKAPWLKVDASLCKMKDVNIEYVSAIRNWWRTTGWFSIDGFMWNEEAPPYRYDQENHPGSQGFDEDTFMGRFLKRYTSFRRISPQESLAFLKRCSIFNSTDSGMDYVPVFGLKGERAYIKLRSNQHGEMIIYRFYPKNKKGEEGISEKLGFETEQSTEDKRRNKHYPDLSSLPSKSPWRAVRLALFGSEIEHKVYLKAKQQEGTVGDPTFFQSAGEMILEVTKAAESDIAQRDTRDAAGHPTYDDPLNWGELGKRYSNDFVRGKTLPPAPTISLN